MTLTLLLPLTLKNLTVVQFSTEVEAAVTPDATDGYQKKTFNNSYSKKKEKEKERKSLNLLGAP